MGAFQNVMLETRGSTTRRIFAAHGTGFQTIEWQQHGHGVFYDSPGRCANIPPCKHVTL